MTRAKRILTGTSAGMLISSLVHASLAGTLYYGFVLHRPAPIVAELDLSMTPLVPLAPNPGGRAENKPETWIQAKKGKAPVPQAPSIVETKEEVEKQENQAAPCPEPCAQGTGEGEGQYVPASQAARKPRWIGNFISSRDYSLVAVQEGKDGRVVLTVWIDEEGRVRDARLLQGSYEILNDIALRKVREAKFSPAYDEDDRPVSCKVALPIRFELR